MRHPIEFGSQSRPWINIKAKTKQKTQTNKEKTKQNVKNKNKAKIIIHTDFPGYSKCGKNILLLFSCDFVSTDATHTYDIILNTNNISILISYSKW